ASAGVGGAGDAVPVEGGVEGAAVRRAIRQVAVIVVHRAHDLPPVARAAAVRGVGSAPVAGEGAGGGVSGEIPEPLEDGPRRTGAGAGQVAVGEVPDRFGRNVRL